MSNSLQGRTVVVFGVANKRSIAWAIAQQMQQAGAQLAITYQNERLKQEADDLIAALPNSQAFQCDVSRDDEIAQLFAQLKERYGKLDAVVHSVARDHFRDDQAGAVAARLQAHEPVADPG